MLHQITVPADGELNLFPATGEEEILQNVALILATPQFTVPLDRGLGLRQEFLDKPLHLAQPLLVGDVLDAVRRSEPRANVVDVACKQGERPGKIIIVVKVEIRDEE